MDLERYDVGVRMCQAIKHNGVVYLAGQVGIAGDNVATQTRTALGRVDELLDRSGSSRSLILSATIWLADISDYEEMNVIWDEWIMDHDAPTRATAEARLANPDLKVEIVVVAAYEGL